MKELILEEKAKEYGLEYVDLKNIIIGQDVIDLLDPYIVKRFCCFPIKVVGSTLFVAIGDIDYLYLQDSLRYILKREIEVVFAEKKYIIEKIRSTYGEYVSVEEMLEKIEKECENECVFGNKDHLNSKSIEDSVEQFMSDDYSQTPNITASEALFGFGSWLTTRKEAVTFSEKYDIGIMVQLILKWCEANNLPIQREGIYPNNIKQPSLEK